MCFLTDRWACLASLSEGIPRPVLGRLKEEWGSPHPALHIQTPNGGLRTQVSTGISSFGNPTGMPESTNHLAPQPTCHHMPAFQSWQEDTCQAGREFWSDKVIRKAPDWWHNFKKSWKAPQALMPSQGRYLRGPMCTSGNYILTPLREFKTLTNTFFIHTTPTRK